MLQKGRIHATVLTTKTGHSINCVAFSVTNAGACIITVLGHTLNQGESVPFNYCGLQYNQKLDISYASNSTDVKVIINEAKAENC